MGEIKGVWVASKGGTVHWHERLARADGTERWAGISRCGMGRFEDHPGCHTWDQEPAGSCATCRRLRARDEDQAARKGLMDLYLDGMAREVAEHIDAQILGARAATGPAVWTEDQVGVGETIAALAALKETLSGSADRIALDRAIQLLDPAGARERQR